jgi:hypothetical protein
MRQLSLNMPSSTAGSRSGSDLGRPNAKTELVTQLLTQTSTLCIDKKKTYEAEAPILELQ